MNSEDMQLDDILTVLTQIRDILKEMKEQEKKYWETWKVSKQKEELKEKEFSNAVRQTFKQVKPMTAIEYIEIKINNLKRGMDKEPSDFNNMVTKLITVLEKDKISLEENGELDKK